jgi:Zn-dependent peptidase ImmA (M78 family)
MGWPGSRVSRLESRDRVAVPKVELDQLVRVLDYPTRFFMEEPTAGISEHDLLFRGLASMTKRERSYLAESFNATADVLAVAQRAQRFPSVRFVPYLPTQEIREIAQVARTALGFQPHEPIPSVVKAMELAGVPVFMPDPPAGATESTAQLKHLGCSAWLGEYRDQPVVLVRPVESWERLRWTYAHEWGHLVMHRVSVPSTAEEDASLFANELLAPIAQIRQELPQTVTLGALLRVKTKWGISMGALIRHLADNQVITAERKAALQRQLYTRLDSATGVTWGKKEPGWDMRTMEKPRMVMRRLEQTFRTTNVAQIAALTSVTQPVDILVRLLANQGGHQAERAPGNVLAFRPRASA